MGFVVPLSLFSWPNQQTQIRGKRRGCELLSKDVYRGVEEGVEWRGDGDQLRSNDHFVVDVAGIPAARPATRHGALEPIHQGIREHFGGLGQGVTKRLTLIHENAPHAVHQWPFPGRAGVSRNRVESKLRALAAGERERRAFDPYPQGAVAVDPAVRD